VSVCIHCGQDHEATGSICRGASGKPAAPAPAAQKTLFGVPPAPFPVPPKPAGAKPGYAATMLAPSARLPVPGKSPLPRLPTAEEARQNPNLVVSLDVTPPPSRPTAAGRADASPLAVPGSDTTVDVPDPGPPVDLPAPAGSGIAIAPAEQTPTDLPPAGGGPRFALPGPPSNGPAPASARSARRAADGLGERLRADVTSVIELLGWAATTYLRRPAPFLLLAATLVLPASFLQSCLATAILPRSPGSVLAAGAAMADFSARKAELAARIQESQARGKIDSEAAITLAALTAAEAGRPALPMADVRPEAGWLRLRLIMLLQGLLVMGMAFPLACGALAVALFDRESGAALPAIADIWPILVARGELFLISLLPAALLVGLGNALFVVPGLVLSLLFLFVPHVVLFEKRGGRPALARSMELAGNEIIRTGLAFLAFALAGAVVALLTELLLPTNASRALAFLHFIVCDLLVVAVLPIPALVLARLYLDLRGPKTSAEDLSRAARS
jgi:hypothetical protein